MLKRRIAALTFAAFAAVTSATLVSAASPAAASPPVAGQFCAEAEIGQIKAVSNTNPVKWVKCVKTTGANGQPVRKWTYTDTPAPCPTTTVAAYTGNGYGTTTPCEYPSPTPSTSTKTVKPTPSTSAKLPVTSSTDGPLIAKLVTAGVVTILFGAVLYFGFARPRRRGAHTA